MRRIIVTEFMSADGVIEAPGGGDFEHAGWTFKDVDFLPEAYAVKGEEQQEASAMLLGRVSFTEFAPVWPSMDEFALYNEMPKYVVSTTLSEVDVQASGWKNSHLLTSLEQVAELRRGEGGPIIVHGSANLVQSLAQADLIDQYTLLEFPIILGSGKRLFASNASKARLELTRSETYANGIRLAVFTVRNDGRPSSA